MTISESQNVEYKESWQSEYLRWICDFANAHGGKIYIRIDVNGNVVGVKNSRQLMEDIPNQIQSTLGIMADVNKYEKDGREYIEIHVPPSSFPVSYHGEYHYRSGSTKQQLKGNALTQFMIHKTGFRWEDVTVDDITVDDLDEESFKIFRREARQSKRMSQEDLNVSNEELLKKLHLMDNGKLKRAAVLLFYHDPSIVQNGSYVKTGKFNDHGLQYEDVLEESLIVTADRIIDLIYLKYLKAKVTYEHDRRIETYPYARDALREAIYNAIAHNCYMYGIPIQIRINRDEIIISNQCILPDGWSVDTLTDTHESEPYNPAIARVFYLMGYIETWGQGIQKIFESCKEIGEEVPYYELKGKGLRVHFKALKSALIDEDSKVLKDQSGTLDGTLNGTLADNVKELIRVNPTITQTEIAEQVHISLRSVKRIMKIMIENGEINRTGGKRYGHWKLKD